MKQFLLLITALVTVLAGFGQVTFPGSEMSSDSNPKIFISIETNQSPLLNDMLSWHISNNKNNKQIEGYRVEIFFSSDADAKDKALKKKVEFLTLYPDNTVHIKYIAPNFRVRVGDFRTKNEALKLFKEIKSTYPLSFIVTDNIDFPLMKPLQYE
ncbi:MAG: SPOR domain-containing protein [Draconibacterium sp.]